MLRDLLARVRGHRHLGLASQFLETIAVRIVSIGLGVVTFTLTARLLGPYGRGAVAAGWAVVALGNQLGNLGLPSANTHFAARDPESRPVLLANSLAVVLALGSLLSAGTLLLTRWWPSLVPIDPTLTMLVIAWMPFQLAYSLWQALLLGMDRLRAYNGIELGNKLLSTAMLLLMLQHSRVWSPERVFLATFLAFVPFVIWSYLDVRRLIEVVRPSLAALHTSLRYSYKMYLGNLWGYLIYNFDLLMVTKMLGNESAGYYSVAGTLASFLTIGGQVAFTILFPKLSALPRYSDRLRVSAKASVIVGAVTAVACVPVVLVAPAVIPRIFGQPFQPSVAPFLWLLPGVLFMSITVVISTAVAASNQPAVTLTIGPVAVILNIVLNLVMIPSQGVVGASIACTITYLAWMLLTIGWALVYQRYYAPSMQ